MGLTDILSDLYTSLTFTDVHADAPPEDHADSEDAGEGEDKSEESNEASEETPISEAVEEQGEAAEETEEEEEAEAEEEEAEEEEPEDIKPLLEEECSRSVQCAPFKHHYEECAERVTAQEADPDHKGPKEDCLEEFFHLTHCATQCAAPKLFRHLK